MHIPDESAAPLLQALEAPLPAEVTGREHGWLTRYRRYPVFSRAWGRGRTLALLPVVGLIVVLTGLPLLDRRLADMPLGGFVQIVLMLFVPLLAGPALGAWVRRRRWSPQREWLGLVTAIASLVLAMAAFHEWGTEPLKQWIAERTGAVDETGQRKRVMMAIGVTVVAPPDGAASANPSAPEPPLKISRAVNALTFGTVTFFMAGGAGLWGWRREQTALASLARERELQRAQAQRREAELRLSVLAAQVEPHFLFNTLAGVRSAIHTDPARASVMVDRLVDYLRAAIPRLRSDGGAEATLGSQLDIVRAYLGLMGSRMPRLAFHIDVPADLLAARCPPLMLISLAENAVKHGVEPKIGPVSITIDARRTDDGRLAITVADDGAGFDAEASAGGVGLGLSNIRERLRQMHGDRAMLSLRARPAGGVAATLTLPLD